MLRPARRVAAVVAALVVMSGAVLTAAGAEGFVFLDANHNRTFDTGETGVTGAVVSDGISVVRTDDAGRFSLPSSEKPRFIFLSTPDGMRPTAGWYLSLIHISEPTRPY